MLRHYTWVIVFFLMNFIANANTLEIHKTPMFINPENISFDTLPPPPTENSSAQQRDIDIFMWEQNSRTYYDIERAWGSVILDPGYFDKTLSVRFEESRFPQLYGLMKSVMSDVRIFTDAYKDYYKRPRPYHYSKDAKPVIPVEDSDSYSYPSGHATRGMTMALVFAEIFPKRRDLFIKTGETLGQDRVIGGVHYPSDVEGAAILAEALAKNILESPAFKAKLKNAHNEIAQIKALQTSK